jgi:hypothetical protein
MHVRFVTEQPWSHGRCLARIVVNVHGPRLTRASHCKRLKGRSTRRWNVEKAGGELPQRALGEFRLQRDRTGR